VFTSARRGLPLGGQKLAHHTKPGRVNDLQLVVAHVGAAAVVFSSSWPISGLSVGAATAGLSTQHRGSG